MKNKRILIVAAHPDDEILGCGGTISKLINENYIEVIFMTMVFLPGGKIKSKYQEEERLA